MQRGRGVGGGSETKERDYGARSCSEVVQRGRGARVVAI